MHRELRAVEFNFAGERGVGSFVSLIELLFPELLAFRSADERRVGWRRATRMHAWHAAGCAVLLPVATVVVFAIVDVGARRVMGVAAGGSVAVAVAELVGAFVCACAIEWIAVHRLRRSLRASLRVQLALSGVATCQFCGFPVQMRPGSVCGECGGSVWSRAQGI